MPSRKLLLALLVALCLIVACSRSSENSAKSGDGITVIATIYPLYDFARAVGGNKIAATMLMPPGSDAHHYEPRPNDIVRVSKADIFLFTSFDMEPWAHKIIKAAAENTNMAAVETGRGVNLITVSDPPDDGDAHPKDEHHDVHTHATKYDPHIWLDFDNARIMVDNIAKAFINRDPKNSDYYKANAALYKRRLAELDRRYYTELSGCKSRTILHAGHWAFAYLAQRYNIRYVAAYNVSADSEPSPKQLMALIEQIKSQKLTHIFYEDMMAPRLAQTLSAETGAGILKLNNGHDIGKNEMRNGVSFLSLMENNLTHLKKGMQCR